MSGEIEQDLPDALVLGLEDGAFGRAYLVDLDRQLMEKFNFTDGPIENWDDYGEHM